MWLNLSHIYKYCTLDTTHPHCTCIRMRRLLFYSSFDVNVKESGYVSRILACHTNISRLGLQIWVIFWLGSAVTLTSSQPNPRESSWAPPTIPTYDQQPSPLKILNELESAEVRSLTVRHVCLLNAAAALATWVESPPTRDRYISVGKSHPLRCANTWTSYMRWLPCCSRIDYCNRICTLGVDSNIPGLQKTDVSFSH